MTTLSTLITADELLAMGDIGPCELVGGEIIHMAPAGEEHGDIAGEMFYRIKLHVVQHKLGKVYAAETGFTIARAPDTTRGADVAFVRAERAPKKRRPGYFDGPPDLAVEVVSPSDRWSEVMNKVDQWLIGGARSVWVVDPPSRGIEVRRPGAQPLLHRDGDTLADEPTLPGFTLNVSEIFDA